ncbi:unnamed protein product [Lactuca saligna]|uniref:Uncharacterized protein n=1 Tax=Lactuca saligna TaxID=75948 RepID=A0AA36EHD4_LACSI|nr:unnamed protein product [Lactuca saligna]
MVYDSIANASIPTSVSNPKEICKKKRVNRTAKFKQSKLHVRREQCIALMVNQKNLIGKNKGFKEENKGNVRATMLGMHTPNKGDRSLLVDADMDSPGTEERYPCDTMSNNHEDCSTSGNNGIRLRWDAGGCVFFC